MGISLRVIVTKTITRKEIPMNKYIVKLDAE